MAPLALPAILFLTPAPAPNCSHPSGSRRGGSIVLHDRRRIIEGMEYFSALPRSGAEMGMYATAAERTPIVSVRLASDMPAADRPHFDYRAADNQRFAAMIASREHPAPRQSRSAPTCAIFRWRRGASRRPDRLLADPVGDLDRNLIGRLIQATPTGPAAMALTGTRASKRRFSIFALAPRFSAASKVTTASSDDATTPKLRSSPVVACRRPG